MINIHGSLLELEYSDPLITYILIPRRQIQSTEVIRDKMRESKK